MLLARGFDVDLEPNWTAASSALRETAQTTPLGTRAYCSRVYQVSRETRHPEQVDHDGVNRTESFPAHGGGLLKL